MAQSIDDLKKENAFSEAEAARIAAIRHQPDLRARTLSLMRRELAPYLAGVDLALEHIANTAPYLASFDEEKLSKVVCDLRLEDASPDELSDAAHMVYTSLAVKTGRWGLVRIGEPEDRSHPLWRRPAEVARAYIAARMTSQMPSGARGGGNHGALVQRLAQGALQEDPRILGDEEMVLEAFETGAWRSMDQSTLRTAMLFSSRLAPPAADRWYRLQLQNEWQRTFSAGEIRALSISGLLEHVIRHIDKDLWHLIFEDPEQRRFLVTDPRIGTEAQRTFQAAFAPDSGRFKRSAVLLQHFAAARDQDWIAPMAYAAFRATSGEIPASCVDRAHSYTPASGGLLAAIPDDILQLLTLADRAGDLAAMATLFADAHPASERTRDLNRLLKAHARWRHSIAQFLHRASDGRLSA